MTLTRVGLQRDPRHRYRWNDGPWCPGTTGIMNAAIAKPGLKYWAARVTADAAVRNLGLLEQMVATGGPDAATNFVKTIPDFQRDQAAALGSRVHTLAEAISRSIQVEVSPDEAPFIDAYMKWRFQTQPEFLNVEFMVFSQKHSYGGTADAVIRFKGSDDIWLVDYKTGKGAYPETGIQLAAYRWADWAGRTDDPKRYKIPPATRFGVLHVRPEGAELIPYSVTDAEFSAFLACRQLHGWLEERAPVIKPMREAA